MDRGQRFPRGSEPGCSARAPRGAASVRSPARPSAFALLPPWGQPCGHQFPRLVPDRRFVRTLLDQGQESRSSQDRDLARPAEQVPPLKSLWAGEGGNRKPSPFSMKIRIFGQVGAYICISLHTPLNSPHPHPPNPVLKIPHGYK